MRLLIFILSALACLAQDPPESLLLAATKPAAGGGGSPGIYSAITNSGPGTSISATLDASSGDNRAVLVYVAWYAGVNVSSATFDGSAMSLLTNGYWYSTTGPQSLYGILSPSTGSKTLTINFDAGATEATLIAVAITNISQTTPWTSLTNSQQSTAYMTNYISSATGELMLSFWNLNHAHTVSSIGASQTKILTEFSDANNQASVGTQAPGSDGVQENWVQWDGADSGGGIGVSLKGP